MSACNSGCGFCGRCSEAWEREDDEEVDDFPVTLKLNAAAAGLASALYYAKHQAWGGNGKHFDALDSRTKQQWVERAAEFLKTVRPVPLVIVTGLRTADSNIVGAIQPTGERP